MLKIKLFLLFFIVSYACSAQMKGEKQKDVMNEDNLFLRGEITEYFEGDLLPGTVVKATSDGKVVAQGASDSEGRFELVLHFDKQYQISFSRGGFVSKKMTIDTRGVPDHKHYKCPDMDIEITLFKPMKCVDMGLMAKPVGRFVYFPKKNVIDADMDYSGPILASVNDMLNDCVEQLEEETRDEERKKEEEVAKAAELAEQKRLEEERVKEEARRKEEEAAKAAALAEKKRLEEEKNREEAEQKRLAEEAKAAELEEQKRLAEEEKRKQEEAKAAELAEQKKLEEKKAQEKTKAAELEEQKRLAEEAKRKQEEAKAAELAEQKKLEGEKAKEEAKAAELEEQKRLVEEKTKSDELANQKQLEGEVKRKEEEVAKTAELAKQKRLAEEKAAEEAKRKQEEVKAAKLAEQKKAMKRKRQPPKKIKPTYSRVNNNTPRTPRDSRLVLKTVIGYEQKWDPVKKKWTKKPIYQDVEYSPH